MLRQERSAPIWLFSFVDLAFLLLIAFTQIGPESAGSPLPIAEVEIPRLHGTTGSPATAPTDGGWQLRIHTRPAPDGADALPFELVRAGAAEAGPRADEDGADPLERPRPVARRIDAEELAAHLALLHRRGEPRPLLVPDRDSRSEDLLVAVGLLESRWRGARSVTVRPAPLVAAERSERFLRPVAADQSERPLRPVAAEQSERPLPPVAASRPARTGPDRE